MEIMLNIGFGVYVPASHLIGLYNTKESFGKKYMRQLRSNGIAKDITGHRGGRTLVEMDNGVIFISAYPTTYIVSRLNETEASQEDLNCMQWLNTKVIGVSKKFKETRVQGDKGRFQKITGDDDDVQ